MSRSSYERLSVTEFGRQLIFTRDLDPMYVPLTSAGLPLAQLKRWMVACVCLYSFGEASWISEHGGGEFWDCLSEAAVNSSPSPIGERWRRGKERRHWRGGVALRTMTDLRSRYRTPEDMVDSLTSGLAHVRCRDVVERMRSHSGFGPCFSFKMADMLERVLSIPVSFDKAEVLMFEEPRKGAILVFETYHPDLRDIQQQVANTTGGMPNQTVYGREAERAAISWAVEYVHGELAGLMAPPWGDRPIGLQEVESVLCKWKSHMAGHYPVGNDIGEARDSMHPWAGFCSTARRLMAALPSAIAPQTR